MKLLTLRVLIAALTLFVAGCASARRAPTKPAAELAAPREADFPAAPKLLAGFDTDEGDPACRIGDRMLFGARLQSKDRTLVRYVLATVISGALPPGTPVRIVPPNAPEQTFDDKRVRIDSPTHVGTVETMECPSWRGRITMTARDGATSDLFDDTPSHLVRVESYDENGKFLARGFAWIPQRVIQCSLFEHARIFAPLAAEYEAQLKRESLPDNVVSAAVAFWRDWLAVACAFPQLLWDAQNLRELLDPMYVPPSLWALITNPGVKARIDASRAPDANRTITLPGETKPWPAVWVPLDLMYGWEHALHVETLIVANRAPFQMCAGVASITVERMKKPDRTLSVHVLAARRGPAPPSAARGAERKAGD